MQHDSPVLIVGGGPVGMTLALELARHGVHSTLVERNSQTTQHPKMDLTNGRSMEFYRRLGLSDRLRSAGISPHNPFDIIWATSFTGRPLYRFAYPSAFQSAINARIANDGLATAEPGMRISQIVLEPILKEAVMANRYIDARFGWKFEGLKQTVEGVTATVSHGGDDRQETKIYCRHLVGCDGGGSRVRRSTNIGLEGTLDVGRVMMIHFRSSDRSATAPFGIAWHLQTDLGSLVAQDDHDTWTAHIPLAPGTDESSLDASAMLKEFIGREFKFELLMANPWTPRLVVADEYSDGNVFLAGDSAHQVIPTGGYGMNTGIGDAIDLGWKLAATVNGWGGPALLQSYGTERRAIALQNRAASERHFSVRIEIAEAYAAAALQCDLDEDSTQAAFQRAKVATVIGRLGNAENESWGIEHGYSYLASPIVIMETGSHPLFDPLKVAPDLFPGSRLPHMIFNDGTALLDSLGEQFSLLFKDESLSAPFRLAADQYSIPLQMVNTENLSNPTLINYGLVLVRPDGHIAWRGDDVESAAAVLRVATGNGHGTLEALAQLPEKARSPITPTEH